jgi:hypothetical protein
MRNLPRAALTFFAICAGSGQVAGTAAVADAASACVQIRPIAGGLIVVPVEIAGDEYPFLLDTGSASTLIDTTLAAELRLPTARRRVVLVTTGGTAEAFASPVSLTFGAIKAPNVEVAQLPLDAIRAIDPALRGVLGQDVLRRSNWLVDYRRGVITQDLDGSLARLVPGYRVAIHWVQGRPAVDVLFGRTPTDLVLDSGATGIVLFDRPPGEAPGGFVHMQSLDGQQDIPIVVADKLQVGALTLPGPRAGIMPRDEDDRGGGGLLPTASFDSIYFDHAGGVAIFDGPAKAGRHQGDVPARSARSRISARDGASRLCSW